MILSKEFWELWLFSLKPTWIQRLHSKNLACVLNCFPSGIMEALSCHRLINHFMWPTMLYYSVNGIICFCLFFNNIFFFLFQVKVMMRICPSLGVVDSSESLSFLKVDTHKKQLTLYDPSLNTQPTSVHRRAVLPAPKMFAFDAVFAQDASQVRASVKMLSFCWHLLLRFEVKIFC